MTVSFFDPPASRTNLLPLSFSRPCSEIRLGITTIREKWEIGFGKINSWKTEVYLSDKYPLPESEDGIWINGCLIPSDDLFTRIRALGLGQGLKQENNLLAFRGPTPSSFEKNLETKGLEEYGNEVILISNLWDIFSRNGEMIVQDLQNLKIEPKKIKDPHTRIYGSENVMTEQGVSIKASILNAEQGPIYLGKNVDIQEGSILYGPLAILEGSQISPGAKIRGNTTIGPKCKIGGEINNVVFFGYSNKAHDGFLGNSVIGEWCNLGADTNNSNLKNNYEEVKLWNYGLKKFQRTGHQFCGLIMGDHSKCSINTMFNTGTVVGFGANMFGSGFHSNFVPSFSWGSPQGRNTFQLERFLQTAEIVMSRRGVDLTNQDQEIFKALFNQTAEYRTWEKI
jgi:UDP-N-acetylglucosamine diphosphorylase/glucosamine-1-phosphate N-acetyltransferase